MTGRDRSCGPRRHRMTPSRLRESVCSVDGKTNGCLPASAYWLIRVDILLPPLVIELDSRIGYPGAEHRERRVRNVTPVPPRRAVRRDQFVRRPGPSRARCLCPPSATAATLPRQAGEIHCERHAFVLRGRLPRLSRSAWRSWARRPCRHARTDRCHGHERIDRPRRSPRPEWAEWCRRNQRRPGPCW